MNLKVVVAPELIFFKTYKTAILGFISVVGIYAKIKKIMIVNT